MRKSLILGRTCRFAILCPFRSLPVLTTATHGRSRDATILSGLWLGVNQAVSSEEKRRALARFRPDYTHEGQERRAHRRGRKKCESNRFFSGRPGENGYSITSSRSLVSR